jgi:hypothetical protein
MATGNATSITGALARVVWRGTDVLYGQGFAVDDTVDYARIKVLGNAGIKEDIIRHAETVGTLWTLVAAGASPVNMTAELIAEALQAMRSTAKSDIWLGIESSHGAEVEEDTIGQVRIRQISKRFDIGGQPYMSTIGWIGIRDDLAF